MALAHEDDIVLVTLRHSRKAYLVEYICSFFLLGLVGFSALNGSSLHRFVVYLFVGLSLFGLVSTEMRRYYGDRYKVMNNKMSIINGVFKIKKRNIYYQPLGFIPDLNVKQTALQRLLNYGTVYLQVGSTVLEFRDVDKPNEVLKMLEELIEKTKRSSSSQQNMMNLPPKEKKDKTGSDLD